MSGLPLSSFNNGIPDSGLRIGINVCMCVVESVSDFDPQFALVGPVAPS